jgi:hypothetical protein
LVFLLRYLFHNVSFQLFDFERTWRWLFQIPVVRTKLDIYVFINWDFNFKINQNSMTFNFPKQDYLWLFDSVQVIHPLIIKYIYFLQ